MINDEIKNQILNAMVEYYGSEYHDTINNIIKSINVYEYQSFNDIENIKRSENYISRGTENTYYILLDKQFYNWVTVDENTGKPFEKRFIAISDKICNTPAKKIYALVKSYIMAFMSNNTLQQNNRIYSTRRGNMYINYSEDDFGAFVPESNPAFYEDACTEYDACNITRNILKVNTDDLFFDDKYNMKKYVSILLDNPSVRTKVNYGRINHYFIEDSRIEGVSEVANVLNEVMPDIFRNEYDNNKRDILLEEQYNNLLPIKKKLSIYREEDEKQL